MVAKKQIQIASLFSTVANLLNVVGASSKRCDILQGKQAAITVEALKSGEMSSGRGLNQSTTKQSGDTC